MNIEIRKLTPELAEDYVNFFDVTPHDDNIDAINVIVCVGAMMNMKVKTFQQLKKEGNTLCNMSGRIILKVTCLY